jgi:hypothetical protein
MLESLKQLKKESMLGIKMAESQSMNLIIMNLFAH